jgi:polyisoprenyl-teichoic acid--peptidoglycan teichoic acid transferase
MPKHAVAPTPRTPRPPRGHRSWLQRAVLSVNAVACVACFVLSGVLAWTWHQVRDIPRIDLGGQLAVAAAADIGSDQAQNVLIVGTDSADGLPEDDPVRIGRDHGVRSDTIMLLRIEPEGGAATLLSLPRDLYVPIAGTRSTARINSAIQGGPARLVATINDALDLPVHHYVEVDFAGFRELVSAIGGIPVYFPEPVRDRHSNLNVTETGCVTLDPEQALAYARSRTYETFRDGHWETDGSGDLGRISRQQDFIRLALHRAFQRGARNPAVLARLIEDGTSAISVDSTLTIAELVRIGQRFRTFDPATLRTLELPVTDAVADGAEVLRLDTARAQPILDVFRGADPALVATDNTVVEVRNGTPSSGLAEEAASALRVLGFVVPPDNTGDAETTNVPQTIVRYHEGSEARAALVAASLNVDPVVEEADSVVGADVSLVIGADWPGVGTTLRAATPGLVPEVTPGPGRSTTTTSPPGATTDSTTSTTLRFGEVPGAAPAGAGC